MIGEAIVKLTKKQDIGYEMSRDVMNEIMNGEATEVQKSAYLVALSMKGETIEEITGAAEAMRNHALPLNSGMEVLEIVGTGGDGSNSFNISTTASLIIAAAACLWQSMATVQQAPSPGQLTVWKHLESISRWSPRMR